MNRAAGQRNGARRSGKPRDGLSYIGRITLSPSGDGPVSLLSVSLERSGGGATYVSHGVPGATVGLLARMDGRILKRELQALDPDLIVLAFGTNEGFDDSLDEAAYKRLFETRVGRLEKLAPRARIAIAGPPDANRLSAHGRKDATRKADRGPA
ncbi:MAG: GDSL-type esterase/lipase family protein [bacterium]